MAQYRAPRDDGHFVPEPGREHPIYPENQSLLIISELEEARRVEEADEDPFLPPDHPARRNDRASGGIPQAQRTPGTTLVVRPPQVKDDYNQKARTPLGLEPNDDDDDDLYFDEDKMAIAAHEERQQQREDDASEFHDEGEEEPKGREWKYSTANLKQRGYLCRYCLIAIFFLFVMAIFALISYIFESIFFKDPGPPPPPDFTKRADNETFPELKAFIDNACSGNTMSSDRGVRCREFCEPAYSSCCDTFVQHETYNFTSIDKALNNTPPPSMLLDDDDFLHLNQCEFTDHTRGCTSYSKCSALKGIVDPAPASLDFLCDPQEWEKDERVYDRCVAACTKVQCCHNEEGLSCLTEDLDICTDYAPCQNLRIRTRRRAFANLVVPVAPSRLDQMCLWKLPECDTYCQKAACCLDENSRCYQENFLACLTYSACEDHLEEWANHTIPPIYSHLPQAPAELMYACGERTTESDVILKLVHLDSCPDYCEQAACCYQNFPGDNCFRQDPLGCLAWYRYCQKEGVAVSLWYAGNYIT